MLEAGEGIADITPPLGIELAGFHKPPGKERRITGIRQPTAARALVLRTSGTQAAIVVLDVLKKKTPTTPETVIETCKRRLAEYDRLA